MFTQWNTRPDGKGDAYKPGEEKEINTDIILYAQWEKLQDNAEDIEKYHVFYRANNNTTAFSVDPQTPKEAGNSILLQNNRFFYADYLFAGWNTKADGSGTTFTDATTVTFKKLSDQEIEDYLDTNEWQGKAGAYAIQGVASKFVEKIDGDLENVIGMPMYKVIKYLEA